jgi:hypothetical protein
VDVLEVMRGITVSKPSAPRLLDLEITWCSLIVHLQHHIDIDGDLLTAIQFKCMFCTRNCLSNGFCRWERKGARW